MKTVMVVFGTRPEAIKMCPLIKELKKSILFRTIVCVTGQHREMLAQVLAAFDVEADIDLAVMQSGQTLFDITTKVLNGMHTVLEKERPDVVLVHGDTTTTFAAGLAAYYMGIPVGHVEAGLRTYNLSSPFPEEFNRQGVGIFAKYHFAPTKMAADHLLREGKPREQIYITGNTVIDALKTTVRAEYSHPVLEWAADARMVLLTAHRRENLGEPLERIFSAVKSVVDEREDVKVIYPVHMNPAVRKAAGEVFGEHPRIRMIEPLDVLDFHNFMERSYMVLTDSGGLQEEAPALGKPVLVLRDTTERPEGIEAGTLRLAGTDAAAIRREFSLLLDDHNEYEAMCRAVNPYGDGRASERIVSILEGSMNGR